MMVGLPTTVALVTNWGFATIHNISHLFSPRFFMMYPIVSILAAIFLLFLHRSVDAANTTVYIANVGNSLLILFFPALVRLSTYTAAVRHA